MNYENKHKLIMGKLYKISQKQEKFISVDNRDLNTIFLYLDKSKNHHSSFVEWQDFFDIKLQKIVTYNPRITFQRI